LPHWSERFLAVSYARDGNGPQAYNCWNYARWVAREQYGRNVPFIPTPASRGSIAKAMEPWAAELGWEKVDAPGDGDAVFLACLRQPTHVGVWVGDLNRVLHCSEGAGPALHDLFHLKTFGWRVCGFYRFTGA
jgi:hypothetical protein